MKKVIILENIRSLHNVGSIFRTADGAGWDKIYCCGYTGTPPDRRIEKVSLGAEEFIEWEKVEDTVVLCHELIKDGFKIVALEQTPVSINLFEVAEFDQSVALVLGNEVDGITAEVLVLADPCIEIPMHGQKSSLNVSVAAGIALYRL